MGKPNLSVLSLKAATQLTPGQTYTATNSDVGIVGSTAAESVVLPENVMAVNLSSSIENLNLSKGIFNYWFNANGSGGVYLFSYTSGLLANISANTLGIHVNFADKSSLTLVSNAQGYAQIRYDKAQLSPNLRVTLPNGDIVLWGSTGTETVIVPKGILNVSCDSAIDIVSLGVNYDPNLLKLGKGGLTVSDANSNKVLDWSVNTPGKHTLDFYNATGSVSVNSAGQNVFTLTDFLLNPGQSYTSTLSNLTLYGANGNETVVIAAGVHMNTIDSKIEKVVLPLPLSKYTWTTQGSNLNLFDGVNSQVALINVVRSTAGTALQFSDQTLSAVISSSGVNVYAANGQVVNSGTVNVPTSSALAPATSPTPTSSSSSTSTSTGTGTNSSSVVSHFQYTLDFSAFSGYASQQTSVQACLLAALNKIGGFLNAKGSLDIQVIPENTSPSVLAEASSAMVAVPSTLKTAHGANYTTAFLTESQTGIDTNGTQADAKVYINMSNWSLFNTNPSAAPSKSQYDLTTVLTHELLHAMGFEGNYPNPGAYQTTYDTYIQMQNGVPYFVGPKAQAVFGGPVPLDPASSGAGSAYYHLKVASDLMSSALPPGTVRSISALDVAVMQDLGAPVIVGVASA
ncbi:MAG: hypothetical protein WCJ99_17995 [Betaproteobacteria bacterium]